MEINGKAFLSGDEAVALACLHAGVGLGSGYPGTPSTEILETLADLGGRAQWAPNEKVALEVAIGAAFGGAKAIATMKHVGLNVAADPLFTCAYTGVSGALLIVSADDPGMASSQNEQDNRHYARAAAVPMLEPSDSQEAYDFTLLGFELSHRWQIPVLLRMTTRVCHSSGIVVPRPEQAGPAAVPSFQRNVKERVMIPAYARPAHRRLRKKLDEMTAWNTAQGPNLVVDGTDRRLGLITSAVCYAHVREAAPQAGVFKIGMTYPLPVEAIKKFAGQYDRVLVIEEGDPYLFESLRAAGIVVEGKPEEFRFGELNVDRVRKIIDHDITPVPASVPGKPPQLCVGCPHRVAFETLRRLECIVSGDIGCYTLGVLPPFEAMDTCVCMGASIGVGLGLRHVLPPEQARKVVSVIGDSTFMHSGVTGIVEMVYNPPSTGHVVIILDNSTTAMTGLQEHPGTGTRLGGEPTEKVSYESLLRSLGVERVTLIDPIKDAAGFEKALAAALDSGRLEVIIAQHSCLLAHKKKVQAKRDAGPEKTAS